MKFKYCIKKLGDKRVKKILLALLGLTLLNEGLLFAAENTHVESIRTTVSYQVEITGGSWSKFWIAGAKLRDSLGWIRFDKTSDEFCGNFELEFVSSDGTAKRFVETKCFEEGDTLSFSRWSADLFDKTSLSVVGVGEFWKGMNDMNDFLV